MSFCGERSDELKTRRLLSFISCASRRHFQVANVHLHATRYARRSNQKPLRVVVGKRIKVKKVENPTEAQVEALHRKFYEEVVRCWGKHKKSMGYEDRELTFVM